MAEFRLSPAAESDLESIWEFSFREWGIEQAHQYVDMMFEVFAVLASSPLSAPACDDVRVGYRRRNVGRHIMFYQMTDYGIAIVRILHERMDVYRHI